MNGPQNSNPPCAVDPLLTSAQVAEALGVHENTIHNWRFLGRHPLPYVKIGGRLIRYRASDVKAFIDSKVQQVRDVDTALQTGGTQ